MTEPATQNTADIEQVRSFWDAHPCGSQLSSRDDRVEYFGEIESQRYVREWHIPIVAQFQRFRGKEVLEVGCGIGTDGVQFSRNGADYVGVDLSPTSVALTQEQFELLGLSAGMLAVANAESLPFEDDRFDHVYSFGVIHHSPDVSAVVKEIYRVLRPGGTLTIMVYNRSSINYRIEISVLRKALRPLLRPAFMPRLVSRVTGFSREKLERHRTLMFSKPEMSARDWVSINTDGPDCPLARVYNQQEAQELFSDFDDVRSSVWYFNRDHWSILGKLIPVKVERWLGRRWGWHRVVEATKPVRHGSATRNAGKRRATDEI